MQTPLPASGVNWRRKLSFNSLAKRKWNLICTNINVLFAILYTDEVDSICTDDVRISFLPFAHRTTKNSHAVERHGSAMICSV